MGDMKKEFFYKGNSTGCLLIHGFTSTPAELYELGLRLKDEGYTVLGVRLKGHGTTIQDMEKCKYTDWIESCEEGYKRLQEQCDKINVIGHSMGSLLALHIASEYEVNKVAALSPPIKVRDKRANFAFLFKHIIKYNMWGYEDRPEDEKKYLLGYGGAPVCCVAELVSLAHKVRKELGKINKPLLIIHSHKDMTVDERSVDILKSNVGTKDVKVVYLEKCGHNITIECEKNKVFDEVAKFLKE